MEADDRTRGVTDSPWDGARYPLRETAAALNEGLGLYLSEEQQQGLAIGLLVGTALAGAIVGWTVADAFRRIA
jgi:hypothetical protein